MEFLEEVLLFAVDAGILMLECIGVCVIIFTGVRGVIALIKHDPRTRLNLAQGMATALEFKLGGEILRTVAVRELSEIIFVGAIIVLRVALTILIHWEIKGEEHEIEVLEEKEINKK